MSIEIKPSTATLGATVTGVDLSRLDEGQWARVESAFHEHAVLVFPDQHLSAEAQLGFALRFGAIEEMEPGKPTIALGNRDTRGEQMSSSSDRVLFSRGNERWHTDSSYMPLSAKASVVSAHVVPKSGGGTEWADTRAAYDALEPALRERIESLSAYHDYAYSQGQLGHHVEPGSAYGFFDGERPLHPIVKRHPVTGRRALYIGRHAWRIPGVEDEEAHALLAQLLQFTCQAPRTLVHEWQVGDVVVWDNRCLLHRAVPYDDTEPRLLMHTRIKGDPASELASNYR